MTITYQDLQNALTHMKDKIENLKGKSGNALAKKSLENNTENVAHFTQVLTYIETLRKLSKRSPRTMEEADIIDTVLHQKFAELKALINLRADTQNIIQGSPVFYYPSYLNTLKEDLSLEWIAALDRPSTPEESPQEKQSASELGATAKMLSSLQLSEALLNAVDVDDQTVYFGEPLTPLKNYNLATLSGSALEKETERLLNAPKKPKDAYEHGEGVTKLLLREPKAGDAKRPLFPRDVDNSDSENNSTQCANEGEEQLDSSVKALVNQMKTL